MTRKGGSVENVRLRPCSIPGQGDHDRRQGVRLSSGRSAPHHAKDLAMVEESIRPVKAGREVISDAEHFFDGWKADAGYTQRCSDGCQAGLGCGLLRHQRRKHARRNRPDHRAPANLPVPGHPLP